MKTLPQCQAASSMGHIFLSRVIAKILGLITQAVEMSSEVFSCLDLSHTHCLSSLSDMYNREKV